MYIEDEKLKKVLEELNDKEKFVIINKIVFDQTDEEISNKLGVGRAAVTNFKNRLYQRIIKRIKNTK
jgi:DNA-directed RNA polymerase specialized sigma subunit